jgi:hypothetical protein
MPVRGTMAYYRMPEYAQTMITGLVAGEGVGQDVSSTSADSSGAGARSHRAGGSGLFASCSHSVRPPPVSTSAAHTPTAHRRALLRPPRHGHSGAAVPTFQTSTSTTADTGIGP